MKTDATKLTPRNRMKVFSKFFIVALVAIAVSFPVMNSNAAEPQTKCPVMGNPIDKNLYADYDGKRVYFCCAMCPPQFAKDPEKFIKKMEEQGISFEQLKEGS